jgi:hypothetical protein
MASPCIREGVLSPPPRGIVVRGSLRERPFDSKTLTEIDARTVASVCGGNAPVTQSAGFGFIGATDGAEVLRQRLANSM